MHGNKAKIHFAKTCGRASLRLNLRPLVIDPEARRASLVLSTAGLAQNMKLRSDGNIHRFFLRFIDFFSEIHRFHFQNHLETLRLIEKIHSVVQLFG